MFLGSSSALLSLVVLSSLSILAFLEGASSSSRSARARFVLPDFGLETGATLACLVLALVLREDIRLGTPASMVEAAFLRGGMEEERTTDNEEVETGEFK